MFICESLMTKTRQFTALEPLDFRSGRIAAVQCLICHGAQIDQKPELVIGVELRQIHVLRFIFCLDNEAAGLRPNVLAFDATVVQHVGRAVHRDADFRQVWVEVLF